MWPMGLLYMGKIGYLRKYTYPYFSFENEVLERLTKEIPLFDLGQNAYLSQLPKTVRKN